MLAIEYFFLAGRYHATPWGHNVNEGIVEWPPSPYRLARALLDTCKRRHHEWSEDRLIKVLRLLQTPAGFWIPYATAAHTRAYLDTNDKRLGDKKMVFDSFVAVNRGDSVVTCFDIDPPQDVLADLDELLSDLNYLGRSESWVRAKVLDGKDVQINCRPSIPSSDNLGVEQIRAEHVGVACLRPEQEYHELNILPNREKGRKKGSEEKSLSWLEALGMSTDDIIRAGWSEPPSQKTVYFSRPINCLKAKPISKRRIADFRFTIAKYALHSTVLPRITQALPIAERIRSKLMGIHKRLKSGDPVKVSKLFSGKGEDGGPAKGHEHIFIHLFDENGDGRIDHLTIKAGVAFDNSEMRALDLLDSIWQPNGLPDISIVLLSFGTNDHTKTGRKWISATPFVTSRHYRNSRGDYLDWLSGEVRRECKNHRLPDPISIEWIDYTHTRGHQLRWMEFIRSRKGEMPLRGHGCILTFDREIGGPFAIGSLCHFGLGLFVPQE